MIKKIFSKKTVSKTAEKHSDVLPDSLPQDAFQIAMQYHQSGDFAQADALYRRILQHDPNHPDALHYLGVLAYQIGQNAAAVELISKAIRVYPTSSPMYCNLGLALQAQGKFDAAAENYQQALLLHPNNSETYYNLGNVLQDQGKFDLAIEHYQAALKLKPDFAIAHNNLGSVFKQQKRLDSAIACYRTALGLKSDYVEAHNNLAITFQAQGDFNAAEHHYQQAIIFKPDYADAYYNLGHLFCTARKLDVAIKNFQAALSLQPNRPDISDTLFYTQLNCCEWSNYVNSREQVIAGVKAGAAGYMPFNFLAISSSAEVQNQCAQRFADKYPPSKTAVWEGQHYQHGKIRIAYVSDDFREHPVAYLIVGLLEQHDRERFEIIAISLRPEDNTATGQRLKVAFDQFITVCDLSDNDVARLMRELEIDIAVDLMGFTGNGRPGIFSFRPVPIQVNYLGFPGGMGASYIDYIIADQQVIPQEQQCHYTEKVVYLPDTYLVNDACRIVATHTPSRKEANLPAKGFVFCCFNDSYKITPAVFTIWMRLLSKVTHSVLWLREANAFAVANLRQEALLRGVAPERLVFAPRMKSVEEHLARQRLADLFLDTLPYNAHTTASDALWVGLPVLTCMGSVFPGRVAGSLLNAVGLPELVTHSLEEYEALAFKLATTPTLLVEIRAKLTKNRITHPLFDTDRFRRHLEAAYIMMWERQQRGELPVSFAVSPIE
jgi:predicted O-linked N-acetylglucosamine transferase (SPINDLY family)